MSPTALLAFGPHRWWSAAAVSPAFTPLQSGVTGGGILALVVTFLVASIFYAVTLHLAATFFIGDVPSQKAATVAPILAAISILLGQYGLQSIGFVSRELGVLIVVVLTIVADILAIGRVYDLSRGPATVLTLLHFAFAAVLGFALNNIFGFL